MHITPRCVPGAAALLHLDCFRSWLDSERSIWLECDEFPTQRKTVRYKYSRGTRSNFDVFFFSNCHHENLSHVSNKSTQSTVHLLAPRFGSQWRLYLCQQLGLQPHRTPDEHLPPLQTRRKPCRHPRCKLTSNSLGNCSQSQLHPCGGSGQQYYQTTIRYTQLADAQGFIVIYPTSPHDSNCWDVASTKSLTHLGGGDSNGLATMVNYTIATYKADRTKVFVTGSSSGGMMTNIMCAVYPDMFAAGSVYSGVPAGCLAGSPGSSPTSANQDCANGKINKTPAQWIAQVKAMYPSYTGAYPKMQIWHGAADNFVNYNFNLREQIKEWTGIFNVSFVGNHTNTPQQGYTQMTYGDGSKVVAYSAQGVGHTVPVHEDVDMKWFGLA